MAEVQRALAQVEHGRERLGGATVDPQHVARVRLRRYTGTGERGWERDERGAIHGRIVAQRPSERRPCYRAVADAIAVGLVSPGVDVAVTEDGD